MFGNIEDMKRKGNVEWLLAFLHDYNDDSEKGWMARLDAAEALVQLGDPRGREYLRQMAESPNPDVREVALEILEGLQDEPADPTSQASFADPPKSESLFFKINSLYPYVVAWAAFVVLLMIGVIVLNPLARDIRAITQTWLPGWVSSLIIYLLLLFFGFLVFRFVIKIFVLPYVNKS